jgi:hypothetical protein
MFGRDGQAAASVQVKGWSGQKKKPQNVFLKTFCGLKMNSFIVNKSNNYATSPTFPNLTLSAFS